MPYIRMAEHRRKRPRDPAQLAKLIVDIATREVEDGDPTPEERGKGSAASATGRKGDPARAASRSPERRAELARKGAPTWLPDPTVLFTVAGLAGIAVSITAMSPHSDGAGRASSPSR
jgi:hypothetical protein